MSGLGCAPPPRYDCAAARRRRCAPERASLGAVRGRGGDPELGLVEGGEEDDAAAGLLQDERVGVGEGGVEDGVDALHVLPHRLGRQRREPAEDEEQQQPHLLRRWKESEAGDGWEERALCAG
jgi:hypothetical protein